MDHIGICSICGDVGPLQSCNLCGALACKKHYDVSKGICTECAGGRKWHSGWLKPSGKEESP